MQKTNKILVEKLNSKNENAYEVVNTNDDIVEMKRKMVHFARDFSVPGPIF